MQKPLVSFKVRLRPRVTVTPLRARTMAKFSSTTGPRGTSTLARSSGGKAVRTPDKKGSDPLNSRGLTPFCQAFLHLAHDFDVLLAQFPRLDDPAAQVHLALAGLVAIQVL